MTPAFLTRRLFCATAAASALLFAPAVFAQGQPPPEPLTIKLTLKRVQLDKAGKEVLVDAPRVAPGDVVEYVAAYANKGAQPIRNLQATLPLPQGVEYQRSSGNPQGALASTDGTNFAPEPLVRTVTGKDGKQVKQPVPYSEYRALRWQLTEVRPGASFEVKARARISQAEPTASAAAPAATK